MKRQRNSYSVEEKQKAVELACRTSNTYAANYYSLDLTMLGRWVENFSQGPPSFKKNLRRVGSGRSASFPEEEVKLYEWIKTAREDALTVTYSSIRIKMGEIMNRSFKQTKNEAKKFAINNFKFLSHWLRRFLKRHNLALRHKTKIAQKLPKDLEDQLLSFQRFVIRLRQKNEYPLNMIANMDETPVWFDMAGSLTVDSKGTKTVHVRTTSNDKNRFTVVLTCLADGTKLPPVIIFKGKVWSPKTSPPPSGVVVWFQDKGWMDEPGMEKWIKYWNSA